MIICRELNLELTNGCFHVFANSIVVLVLIATIAVLVLNTAVQQQADQAFTVATSARPSRTATRTTLSARTGTRRKITDF